MVHIPVLVEEVVELLDVKVGKAFVDATLGGGGHAQAILKASSPYGKLIGIDRDHEAIRMSEEILKPFENRTRLFHANFSEMEMILEKCESWIAAEDERVADTDMPVSGESLQVDGFLFDLGLSSFQIDYPERGFSYEREGPLDMRMNQRRREAALLTEGTAGEVVNNSSVEELTAIIKTFGEERFAKKISKAIERERRKEPILSTLKLAEIVRRAVPRPKAHKSVARVFQSLRIFINEELEELKRGLSIAFEHVKPGGRIGVISYHSLEDRIVKNFFRARKESGELEKITKKVVKSSFLEIERNRRARSAKLRVIEKLK
jgi:16S rRNA (cytosine1402-N4)-methyltransferase